MAGEEPSKVTTESSRAVLKAVAGRLEKIEVGEMPTLHYVGGAGGGDAIISHTGEVQQVASESPLVASGAGVLRAESRFSDVLSETPEPTGDASVIGRDDRTWQPSVPKAAPRKGFFARLFGKLFGRSDDVED